MSTCKCGAKKGERHRGGCSQGSGYVTDVDLVDLLETVGGDDDSGGDADGGGGDGGD